MGGGEDRVRSMVQFLVVCVGACVIKLTSYIFWNEENENATKNEIKEF